MNCQRKIRTIFAKFCGDNILEAEGRRLFAVLYTFASSGYQVQLFDNIHPGSSQQSLPYFELIDSIENVVKVSIVPPESPKFIYLFDRIDKYCAKKKWHKKIQVKLDIFSSYRGIIERNAQPVISPFPMHPLHYDENIISRLEYGRKRKRKMRLFFSGETKGYKRRWINFPEAKLTRSEILETIEEKIGDEILHVPDTITFDRLLAGAYIQNFILPDNRKFRVETNSWLETLSLADFFLCAPGYVLPMCHNTVEAMAVGTIPVINYPEWFNPDLVDMETCVTFKSKAELIEKFRYVINMRPEKIAQIRTNVADYYDKHLDPARCVKKIESSNYEEIDLLILTVNYVSHNFRKLNDKSILIAGEPKVPGTIWNRMRHLFGT